LPREAIIVVTTAIIAAMTSNRTEVNTADIRNAAVIAAMTSTKTEVNTADIRNAAITMGDLRGLLSGKATRLVNFIVVSVLRPSIVREFMW
jgi:hypothetical protein